jgi:RNA polymerase sigma factor (sigma-70 family)
MSTATLTQVMSHLRTLAAPGGESSDEDLLRAFAAAGDERAFAAIVSRYGSLVLGVCRRALRHEQDAEDAFQATFLVLARNASSIRKGQSLPCWLHGVCHRVTLKTRRSAARRRRHEERAPVRSGSCPWADPTWREVQALLDEEVRRLPAIYREPFIRCCLEGLGRAEAARLLRLKEGTLSSRLAHARQVLQRRLRARGVTLTGLLGGSALVSPSLAAAAVRAATTGFVPGPVLTLPVRGRLAVALLFLGGLAALGLSMLPRPPVAAGPPAVASRAERDSRAEPGSIEVRGRVLGPDGKPLAGARLQIADGTSHPPRPAPQARSGPDGRFAFRLGPAPVSYTGRYLLASADGQGLDWYSFRADFSGNEITLRLPGDTPIAGKVVDLEGRAVAGARVGLFELRAPGDGKLDAFLALRKSEKDDRHRPLRTLERRLYHRASPELLPLVRTDRQGKFRLRGVGRERVAILRIRAAGYADELVQVATRPGFRPDKPSASREALHGPEVLTMLSPGKPILGKVVDDDKGKPVAGVTVKCSLGGPHDYLDATATSDASGRYHLTGLRKRREYTITFQPPAEQPLLPYRVVLSDSTGVDPLRASVRLQRGVVVRGRLVNTRSKEGVRGNLIYQALAINGEVARIRGYPNDPLWRLSDERGRFQLTVPPGPGVLLAQDSDANTPSRFRSAVLRREDNEPSIWHREWNIFRTSSSGGMYPLDIISGYRIIRPGNGAKELSCNIDLEPGTTRSGKLVGPDGQPVPGATAYGLRVLEGRFPKLPGAAFTAYGLDPAAPRDLLFWHPGRKLARAVQLRGDEKEPVVVRLEPTGAVQGRIVDAAGRPLAGAVVEVDYQGKASFVPALNSLSFSRQPTRTDGSGRFRVEGLVARQALRLVGLRKGGAVSHEVIGFQLKPGESKDVGDVKP